MTDNASWWEVCVPFQPSALPLWKLHELWFLIGLPCTTRLWSLKRWRFVSAGSLPTTQHLIRLSSSLASASLSACGHVQCPFIGKFEHILFPCVHSQSLNDSWEQKKNTTLLFSLCICSPFVFVFLYLFFFYSLFIQTGIGQRTINLFLKQAEAQWVLAGL